MISPEPFQRAKTYRLNKPKPGTIRVWTIQDWPVWEALQDEEYLYVSPELMNEGMSDCRDRYDWMRNQMRRKLTQYEGHYPWWAYHGEKPDLRKSQWSSLRWGLGTRNVRLELALPPERVLIFSDTGWTRILNGYYIPTRDEEWDEWDVFMEELGFASSSLFCVGRYDDLPLPWRDVIETSWFQIFDPDSDIWDTDWRQAVFERLDLADVVAVTEFMGRGKDLG